MFTVTIDNQTIQVGEQLTILEVAKNMGIDIPTLCHDRRLKPFGTCRICIVEVEPGNRLVASCHTKVLDNMEVRTHSERVIQARKLNMELVLARHPQDCLVCDRGGECNLQKVTFRVCQDLREPIPTNRIVDVFGAKPMEIELNDNRSIIERDLNKCILCRKCVRVCDEVMGVNAVCYSGRGSETQIGTFYSRRLDCEFCGQCVDICPVGSLFSKLAKYRSRVWETREAYTICAFCGSGCNMVVRTKRGELVRVLGDPNRGINNSNLCVKGRYGYDFLNSKGRLKRPLIRREGKLQEVDWETAFSYTAKKLKAVMEKDGSETIAGVGSVLTTNEDNYVFQKFMRTVLGTNHIDTYARMEHAISIPLLTETLGYPTASVPMDDFSHADLIVLAGCNVTESHPIVGIALKKAVRQNKVPLLVIDPQDIKMNRFSTQWLQNDAGSDVAILNGIMHLLVKKKKIDQQFISDRTEGFDGLKQSLEKVNPSEVETISGISQADLAKAAKLVGESKKIIFIYGMGLTQQKNGIEAVTALLNLSLLTGAYGVEGAGIFPARGFSNSQGVCDMGVLPDFLPGYQAVSDPESHKMYQWGQTIPDKPGLTLTEMIPAAEDGKIKAMVVMGENLLVALPGRNRVEAALKKLEFLVVSDLFLTETAELADVVLPSRFLTEKDGCITNTERRIQRVRKALDPLGDMKADWEIWSGVADAMGTDLNYKLTSDIMEEISNQVPGYIDIRYDKLDKNGGGVLWPINPETKKETTRLYQKEFPVGKAKFHPVQVKSTKMTPTKEYPYNLMAGKTLFQFHTGTFSGRSNALSQLVDEPFVGINPEEAERIRVKEEDRIRISTKTGEAVVKVKFMNSIPEKTIFVPIHFDKIFNALFGLQTPMNIKNCPAKLETF